jgi:hypothetical protein
MDVKSTIENKEYWSGDAKNENRKRSSETDSS